MESVPTDLTDLDRDATIARRGIEQSIENHRRLFRELGIVSTVGSLETIDPEKLHALLIRHGLDRPR